MADIRSSIARDHHHSLEISALEKARGWGSESWQAKLLEAVDAAGIGRNRNNGRVTAREVDAYLRAPPAGTSFITSTQMQEERAALDQDSGVTVAKKVDDFDHAWEDRLAKQADASGDGVLTRQELDGYLSRCKSGTKGAPLWLPDQEVAMLDSDIEDLSGGTNVLSPKGPRVGTELRKDYMRLVMDDRKNAPQWVSFELSAADIAETPSGVDRDKSHWAQDPDLPYPGVTDSDYVDTGFDRGHIKPAEDSPDQAAMDESHLMTNVAPEYPTFNRQTWRTLEQAVNELVIATGGKADIVTGTLYLDKRGKPLPVEDIPTTGSGKRRIAVPTHIFKAVRLTKPDGTVSEFAFVVPNTADAPVDEEGIGKLLRSSRASIDQVESLLGQDLFGPGDPAQEADADPKITFPNAGHYHAASLVWPQGVPLETPYVLPNLWKDSVPDWFRNDLRHWRVDWA